jgi:YaiO family outer membrane protein
MIKNFFIVLILLSSLSLYSQSEDKGNFQFLTGYYNDVFNEPFSRNFNVFYSGLGYKSPNTSIYGKVNFGWLESGSEGFQYELDYYQRITKGLTSWWNYAYSENENFPTHRAMMRLWQELPAGFLVSGGLRYFYFDQSLYTASIGLEKYMGRFWVEGLGYIHFKDPNPRLSYQLNSRVFWRDYNYVQLSLFTGAAQDEPWVNGGISPNLNSHGVNLGLVTYLDRNHRFQLRANFGYQYEEYLEGTWRNRFTSGVGMVFTIF